MTSLWFRYSGSLEQRGRFINGDGDGDGDGEEETNMDFNDLAFYQQLLNENGCRNAKIARVCVQHNDYCHGIQAVYRLTFDDGRIELRHGPTHFYASGWYSYHGRTERKRTWLVLEEDEYLTGLIVNQGEILDGITFVTNKRRMHYGGNGGSPLDMVASNPPTMKIVAFCGTSQGVCERIGFYSSRIGWQILGPHILMRQLVGRGRATILPANEEDDLAFVVQRLTTADDDVFRQILSFLA